MMKVIAVVLTAILVFVMLSWRIHNYDYQCKKCGEKFNLTIWEVALSPHIMGNRYVKCPKCGKWCWANPIPK